MQQRKTTILRKPFNVLFGAHFIFIESCDQSRCYRIPLSLNSSDFDDNKNEYSLSLSVRISFF